MMITWTAQGIEMEEFSKNLKTFRNARGLNQNQVAALLSVSPRVYNRWERGSAVPRLDTLVRLADIFNVTLDELSGRKEPQEHDEIKVRNPKLHSLYRELDKLSHEDQKALVILLDSLIKRSQMGKLLTS